MKKTTQFLLLAAALMFSAVTMAQSTITGIVMDADLNAPLPGANIIEKEDSIIVEGVDELEGNVEVWSHKDHRIAMTLAIVSSRCNKPIVIKDYDCVSKSYPKFFEDFEKIGGISVEWNVGQ